MGWLVAEGALVEEVAEDTERENSDCEPVASVA